MPDGYTRAQIRTCGAGAGEVWTAVLEWYDRLDTDGSPRSVGQVRQVYDRSAYLEFDRAVVDEADLLGPPLVLLARDGFDGPLATVLDADDPGGFRPDRLIPGARCRLRMSVGTGRTPPRPVLRIGDRLDIQVDLERVTPIAENQPHYHDLVAIPRGGPIWRRSIAALDVLEDRGVEDGLGWLPSLVRLREREGEPEDLRRLADGWAALVDPPTDEPPGQPPTDILGRGPGATPAGDDVLAGLLLTLNRTAAGDRQNRVRRAGERVVAAASDRTTIVSTALLAQAVRGRASDRIEASLRALLTPDLSRTEWESAVLETADIGHTSGVDTIVGMLVVTLVVGPMLHERG